MKAKSSITLASAFILTAIAPLTQAEAIKINFKAPFNQTFTSNTSVSKTAHQQTDIVRPPLGIVGARSVSLHADAQGNSVSFGASAKLDVAGNAQQNYGASTYTQYNSIKDTISFNDLNNGDENFTIEIGLSKKSYEVTSSRHDKENTSASIYFSLGASTIGIYNPSKNIIINQIDDINSPNNKYDILPMVLTVNSKTKVNLMASFAAFAVVTSSRDSAGSYGDEDFAIAKGSFEWYIKTPEGISYSSANNVAYASEVPVPAAAWLFGSALVGLAGLRRKK